MKQDANQLAFQERITRIQSGKQWVPDGVIVTQRGKAVVAGRRTGKAAKRRRKGNGRGLLMVLVLALGLGLGAVAFPDAPVVQSMMAGDIGQVLSTVAPQQMSKLF